MKELNDSNVTGWITPKSEFIECPQYCHLDPKHFQDYEDVMDFHTYSMQRLDRIELESKEAILRDEYPEWHIYEMASNQYKCDLRDEMLRVGFIRVGTMRDTICFELTLQTFDRRRQFCLDLAEEYNYKPEFEIKKV